jgi:deazaflavin-dependent oxidoreductase (nitroreductase family)
MAWIVSDLEGRIPFAIKRSWLEQFLTRLGVSHATSDLGDGSSPCQPSLAAPVSGWRGSRPGMSSTGRDVAPDMDFNQQIIETFRANAGEVNDPIPFGKSLVLVHVPKKDGTTRVAPLASIHDDGAWYVVGSAGGSPRHPAWVHGLRRQEQVDIEVPGEPVQTISATVEELTDDDRDAVWERFKKMSSGFAGYEKTAEGRVFPIFRLAS